MMRSVKDKKNTIIEIAVMLTAGFVFYFLLGNEWISIQDDSPVYMNLSGHEGVMPVYPIFLFLVRYIVGETHYLSVVVCIQSGLALISTMIFVCFLKKQFTLKDWETFLLYLFCMMPFSIYLPESGITHQIMTEGIAYALFYIYFLFLMKYIYSGKGKWLIALIIMAVFLELTRSQLIFLHLVWVMAFVYVQVKGKPDSSRGVKIRNGLISFIMGCGVMLLSIVMVYKVYGYYISDQLSTMYRIQNGIVEEAKEEKSEMTKDISGRGEEKKKEKTYTISQMTSLLMIRGFYEVDPEDVELFQSPEMKEIFKRVYSAVDKEKCRYVYARQDLYMWKDLVKDQIPGVALIEIKQYLAENPETGLEPTEIMNSFGRKVLFRHFGRYLYHTTRTMISSFISSIFFQIQRIYLLCHFITLGLYLASALGCIMIVKRNKNIQVAEFTGMTVGYIIIMVVVTNLVFIGLQRYMVYAMGIFYCTLYMEIREVLKEWSKKLFENRSKRIIGEN